MLNETITNNNIEELARAISIYTMKKLINGRYYQNNKDKLVVMYKGLLVNVYDKKPIDEILNDGFDIYLEAACLLSNYKNHKLKDPVEVIKKNGHIEKTNIIRACVIYLTQYVRSCLNLHEIAALEHLEKFNDPFDSALRIDGIEIEDDPFIELERLINKLGLTKKQREVLNYRLSGVSYDDIAEYLQISKGSVQDHIKWIRKKYNETYLKETTIIL